MRCLEILWQTALLARALPVFANSTPPCGRSCNSSTVVGVPAAGRDHRTVQTPQLRENSLIRHYVTNGLYWTPHVWYFSVVRDIKRGKEAGLHYYLRIVTRLGQQMGRTTRKLDSSVPPRLKSSRVTFMTSSDPRR